jgi:hypothetical protein
VTLFDLAIQFLDWEEVMALAAGCAAVAYVIVDQKRERHLNTLALDFGRELQAHSMRIDALEGRATTDLDNLQERIAAYAERVAVIEARIDYAPAKPTVPRTPAATPKEGKAK